MILLIAKNTLKPGNQAAFLELAGKMVVATRAEEGCVSYELAADDTDDTVFYFIETYKDEAALEAHRATTHFRTYVPQIGALRTKPSELTQCTTLTV